MLYVPQNGASKKHLKWVIKGVRFPAADGSASYLSLWGMPDQQDVQTVGIVSLLLFMDLVAHGTTCRHHHGSTPLKM